MRIIAWRRGAVTFKMDLSEKVETPFQMMGQKCVSCKVFSIKLCLDLQQNDDRIIKQTLLPEIRFDKSFFAAKISLHNDSSVVQSVERRTVNPYVTGSSPVRGAKFKKPAFRAGFLLFCVREIVGWRLRLTRPTESQAG